MKASWQKARLEVLTRARNVQQHLNQQFVQNYETEGDLARFEVTQHLYRDAAAITALDCENTAMLQVYTDLVYDRMLSEDFRTRLGVILIHGLVGLTRHAWLCVEGEVAQVSADADRCVKLEQILHISSVGLLRWRVIVDAAAIDIEPSILLIAPTCPLMPQYIEQERFTEPVDYSKALIKVREEGVADETQENLILKALENKHV